MPSLFFGKMLHVDLSSGLIDERDIDAEVFEERIGGAALCADAMRDVADECLSIASGPLTATGCPGGSAAVLARKDHDGVSRFAPLLLNAGLEFRLSGFDLVVIEGRAESPHYLWIRDQVADLVPLDEPSGADTWSTCSRIRAAQGDPRIQVVSHGPGRHAALNFASGWDGISAGEAMRSMNLRAIAFRGLGEVGISDPQGFLSRASDMMAGARSLVNGRSGMGSLLGKEQASRLASLGRPRACNSCPFPCMSYAPFGGGGHSHVLLMDQRSLSRLCKLDGAEISLYRAMARLSMTGAAAGESIVDQDVSLDSLADDAKPLPAEPPERPAVFDTITDGAPLSAEVVAAYVLGLCPRFISVLKPDIRPYLELVGLGTGVELRKEKIDEVVASISGGL